MYLHPGSAWKLIVGMKYHGFRLVTSVALSSFFLLATFLGLWLLALKISNLITISINLNHVNLHFLSVIKKIFKTFLNTLAVTKKITSCLCLDNEQRKSIDSIKRKNHDQLEFFIYPIKYNLEMLPISDA